MEPVMNLSDSHTYRALRGGVWERTRSCGWYRLSADQTVDRACRIPAGLTGREDHRTWHSYIWSCIALTVVSCLLAVAIGAGV